MWNKLDNNFSLVSFLFLVNWRLSILYSSFFCVPFVFQFKFFLFSCMRASPNFFHFLMFCLFVHELDLLLVCRSPSCQLCYSPFSPSFLSTHCMICIFPIISLYFQSQRGPARQVVRNSFLNSKFGPFCIPFSITSSTVEY